MNLSINKILKQIEDLYNERGQTYGNSYLDTRDAIQNSVDLVHTMIQLKNDRIKAINKAIVVENNYTTLFDKRNAELIDISLYAIIELSISSDWEESLNGGDK